MSRPLLAAATALTLLLSPLAQAQNAAGAASAPAAAAPKAEAAAPAAGVEEGKLAFYGRKFAGRKTASGERFNPGAMTMAHKSLPFGTRVKVTNLKTGKSVVVRVNDRGPMNADRIGDVSQAAAAKLRMLKSGVVQAKLEVLGGGKATGKRKARKA